MGETSTKSSFDELRQLCRTYPVIDNHAHNLLRPHGQKVAEFLIITSEADGDALEDAPTSLAHLRAARLLRRFYDLPGDADWHAIVKKRKELLEDDADGLFKRCFEGTETILIDDGLTHGDSVEPYYWHDKYTRSPCKRIVRIEALASDILSSLYQQNKLPVGYDIADEEACALAWVTFIAAFEQAIAAALEDPDVVSFKSVVCYRSGLDVQVGRDVDVTADGLRSFRRHFLPECVSKKFRIEAKGMNDAIVISTCKLIAASFRQRDFAKPLQFHTGLGDNDISLLHSNPGCLQPLIKAFPTVPIVLLHSSYPYTREGGYLATVYKNCYLDLGEVFPMVSRDGQEKILRQAFELTPWSKLLWSTDGHYFPETYWLANVQGRRAMEKVMCEYVDLGDLSMQQATQAVKDVFFGNSNRLYDLRLKLNDTRKTSLKERPKDLSQETPKDISQERPEELSRERPRELSQETPKESSGEQPEDSPRDLPKVHSEETRTMSPEQRRDTPPDPPKKGLSTIDERNEHNNSTTSETQAVSNTAVEDELDRDAKQASDPKDIVATHSYPSFLDEYTTTQLVFVQWLDYLGQLRSRCVPILEFTRLAKLGERIRISYGNLGTLQNDHFTPVCNPVGSLWLDLDYATLRPMQDLGRIKDTATVMAGFVDDDAKPIDLCPRMCVAHFVKKFFDEYKVEFLIGFEIEVTFCRRNPPDAKETFAPMDTMHAWGTFTDVQYTSSMPLMTDIMAALMSLGIGVQQMHSEAGPGQYEFILPPLPPVHAVDTLYQARQCISQIAALHGLRATYYPTPFPGVGTAAHAHISFNSHALDPGDLAKLDVPFMASVLDHLPSLCAFTMPQAASYGRVIDNSWTGGTWIAWGWENREVPLRKSGTMRWEIRCMDGCANMYLALAAIFAAGYIGVRNGTEMKMKDTPKNPTKLSDEEKKDLGITKKLPTSIKESVQTAEQDSELEEALPPGVLKHFIAMKMAEQVMLNEMPEEQRKVWLMERY